MSRRRTSPQTPSTDDSPDVIRRRRSRKTALDSPESINDDPDYEPTNVARQRTQQSLPSVPAPAPNPTSGRPYAHSQEPVLCFNPKTMEVYDIRTGRLWAIENAESPSLSPAPQPKPGTLPVLPDHQHVSPAPDHLHRAQGPAPDSSPDLEYPSTKDIFGFELDDLFSGGIPPSDGAAVTQNSSRARRNARRGRITAPPAPQIQDQPRYPPRSARSSPLQQQRQHHPAAIDDHGAGPAAGGSYSHPANAFLRTGDQPLFAAPNTVSPPLTNPIYSRTQPQHLLEARGPLFAAPDTISFPPTPTAPAYSREHIRQFLSSRSSEGRSYPSTIYPPHTMQQHQTPSSQRIRRAPARSSPVSPNQTHLLTPARAASDGGPAASSPPSNSQTYLHLRRTKPDQSVGIISISSTHQETIALIIQTLAFHYIFVRAKWVEVYIEGSVLNRPALQFSFLKHFFEYVPKDRISTEDGHVNADGTITPPRLHIPQPQMLPSTRSVFSGPDTPIAITIHAAPMPDGQVHEQPVLHIDGYTYTIEFDPAGGALTVVDVGNDAVSIRHVHTRSDPYLLADLLQLTELDRLDTIPKGEGLPSSLIVYARRWNEELQSLILSVRENPDDPTSTFDQVISRYFSHENTREFKPPYPLPDPFTLEYWPYSFAGSHRQQNRLVQFNVRLHRLY